MMIKRVWGNAWIRWGLVILAAFAAAVIFLEPEQLRVACAAVMMVGALSAANNWFPDAVTTARLGQTGTEQRIIVGQSLVSGGLVYVSLYIAVFNVLGKPSTWSTTAFMPFGLLVTAVGLFLSSSTPDGYVPTGSAKWRIGFAALLLLVLAVGFMAGAAFGETAAPGLTWWP